MGNHTRLKDWEEAGLLITTTYIGMDSISLELMAAFDPIASEDRIRWDLAIALDKIQSFKVGFGMQIDKILLIKSGDNEDD